MGGLFIVLVALLLIIRHVRIINRRVDKIKDLADQGVEKKLVEFGQQSENLDKLYRILKMERGALPPTRGWAASPDFLVQLAEIILEKKPKVIVELGSGTSSLVIGQLLKKIGDGHLFSYDHSEMFMAKTRKDLDREGLSEFVTLYYAPISVTEIYEKEWLWYDLENIPEKIDMIIVDGPPMATGKLARYPAAPLLFPHTNDDAIILFDDAIRPDEKEMASLYETEFPNWKQSYIPLEKGMLTMTKN